MESIRDVRRQLMAYNGLRADRDELLRILKGRDQDIHLGSSFTDGMPRQQGGLPRSSVEGAAIRREEELAQLLGKLEELNLQLVPIERSLAALHWREQQIIRHVFFSLDDETAIAAVLGLSVSQLHQEIKYAVEAFSKALDRVRPNQKWTVKI